MFIVHNGAEGRGEREGLSDPIRSVIWCGSTIIQRNIVPTSITSLYTRRRARQKERGKREAYQEESNGFAVVFSLLCSFPPRTHINLCHKCAFCKRLLLQPTMCGRRNRTRACERLPDSPSTVAVRVMAEER